MKFLMVLFSFSLLSFSAFAARDPQYCGRADTCVEDRIPLVREGTFYARGNGHDCRQAEQEARDNFQNAFGDKDNCGLYRAPFNVGCIDKRDGSKSVWLQCTPRGRGGNNNRRSTPRCLNAGSRMIC